MFQAHLCEDISRGKYILVTSVQVHLMFVRLHWDAKLYFIYDIVHVTIQLLVLLIYKIQI